MYHRQKVAIPHIQWKKPRQRLCRQRMSLKLSISGSVFELEQEARGQRGLLGWIIDCVCVEGEFVYSAHNSLAVNLHRPEHFKIESAKKTSLARLI
jgi:hypothetical protein